MRLDILGLSDQSRFGIILMKMAIVAGVLTISMLSGRAQTPPIIISSPTNITVFPGGVATFAVNASNASGYQWQFGGNDISGASNAVLQISNASSTNCGYYDVIVRNSVGYTPSQLAYLTLDYTFGGLQPTACGTLPLSNTNDTYSAGDIETAGIGGNDTPTNGTVQIIAGPELDEMQRIGRPVPYGKHGFYQFQNGYYSGPDQPYSLTQRGQNVYYSVAANYTNNGATVAQPSTIIKLVTGTNGLPAPSCYGLKFPGWFAGEGVEPIIFDSPATNQLRVSGESFSLTNSYIAYTDYGIPTAQWRKDGVPITGATNNSFSGVGFGGGSTILMFTNVEPSDAGIYDAIIYGNEWVVSAKIAISIQTTNGNGVFRNPRFTGTNFIADLEGAVGRNYDVQYSTNLVSWNDLASVSNTTGTVTITNPAPSAGAQFYRTVLLP